MKQTTTTIDMLHGALPKKILLFTLPIALSSMLQQLFHAADTSIVGYFDTATSLAAVGTNGEIIALIVSLSSGLSIGANILIAQQIGQQKKEHLSGILKTALLFAGIFGIIGLLLRQCITNPLLLLIKTPGDVMAPAKLYLRIYFLGYPFLLLFDFGSAILRAKGDSRYPFLILTIAGILNVLLNLFFVLVFHIGVAGVALATVLSTAFSAIIILLQLWNDSSLSHVSFFPCRMRSSYLIQILKNGIPAAIQGAVFCFANIFIQASVNRFGAQTIAGSTIAMNFEYFSYYVITAFGQTATTFVSQNYAAGQKKRCRQILWLCITFSFFFSLFLIVPIILFRNRFAGFFSTEPAVIENACIRMMCILLFEPVCSFYEIPAGVLRGMGRSLFPAIATVIGTCAFRILWIYTVFQFSPQLETLYRAFPVSWVITTIFILCGFFVH